MTLHAAAPSPSGAMGTPIGEVTSAPPPRGTLSSSDVVLEVASSLDLPSHHPHDSSASVYHRPLTPDDLSACVDLHRRCFPIEYEDAFYASALAEAEGIITLAAMERQPRHPDPTVPLPPDVMVGVVTARCQARCEEEDRAASWWLRPGGPPNPAARLAAAVFGEPASSHAHATGTTDGSAADDNDATPYLYVLTLGVLPSRRRRGLASALLEAVARRAARERGCVAAYLHVISHDRGALRLYRSHGFAVARRLKNFYTIPEERAPEPGRTRYDALLLARRCVREPTGGAASAFAAGRVSPVAELARLWMALRRLLEDWWRRVRRMAGPAAHSERHAL